MPYIRVHDLVEITVDDDFPWFDDWRGSLGDLPASDGGGGARIEVRHVPRIDTAGLRELDEGMWGRPGLFADTVYGIRLRADGDALVLEADNPALEWAIWMVALAALRAGAAMVHGAGLCRDGRAVLFPSWGGVGKTALVAALVRDRGWSLLGDDLVLLGRDGVARALPKPMVLYPYHRGLFPEVFDAGEGPVAPVALNRALTRVGRRVKPALRAIPGALRWARRHNPQSVRVPPSRVFGTDAIGARGQVAAAVWLERVPGLAAPRLVDAPSLRAQVLGATLNEFDPRCVRATHIAMGLGILGDDDLYPGWTAILGEGLAGVAHRALHLPADLPVDDLPAAVEASGALSGGRLG